MKLRIIHISAGILVAATGVVLLSNPPELPSPADPAAANPQSKDEPERPSPPPEATTHEATPPSPSPASGSVQRQEAVHPVQGNPAPVDHDAGRPSANQQDYSHRARWRQAEEHFNTLLDRLDEEQDPGQRYRLIQSISQYVRMDTLGTIEWAMSMADPEEKRTALEAISKYALSGIGARIEVDDTGFPRIRETTALSAIAATGQVEPGDYIAGIVGNDGQTVYFNGMSVQQIISHLRGQPGSEVQLIMERIPDEGSRDSASFDVTVQRSLLVIQPPY